MQFIQQANGALAQLGERQVRNLEVRGSIPLCSTTGYSGQSAKRLGFADFFIYFGGDQKYEKNFLRMQYTTQAPIYSQNFAVRLWNGWYNSMTKN